MANKKYYAVMKFETKEDFDKRFDDIYNSGYESGYEDGMVEAVSYMFEMLDHFSPDTQDRGLCMNGDRKKRLAIKNMKAGITPIVATDPAIRKSRQEFNRMMSFNKIIKEVIKES